MLSHAADSSPIISKLKSRRAILIMGDVVALLLFVFVGQRDHETLDPANPLLGVVLTALPFIVPWLIAGFLLNAYPNDNSLEWRSFIAKTINLWLVATPLGILLRTIVLGRAVILLPFVLAALGFIGLFLMGWRLLFVLFLSPRLH